MTKTIERKGREGRKALFFEEHTASVFIGARELVFAVLAVFAFFFLSDVIAAQTPAAAAPSGNAQSGKELYAKYSCYACHGYDGHGGAGARLVPMRMNLPGFTAYIKNPRQMPPYTAKVLSDAQAADLFAYIKSIPESPSADKIPLLTRIMGEK
jgi:ubiquinol-cytochrome c reductase cytochrome c subunit